MVGLDFEIFLLFDVVVEAWECGRHCWLQDRGFFPFNQVGLKGQVHYIPAKSGVKTLIMTKYGP